MKGGMWTMPIETIAAGPDQTPQNRGDGGAAHTEGAKKAKESESPNAAALETSVALMFHNLRIAMDTVDWNANICGAPAWRYIYHTIHSAHKWFINPGRRFDEPEPPFHTPKLDWPDTPADIVLSRETLYSYYEQVRKKILDYVGTLDDAQLSARPEGCVGTRLTLALGQFRHMYAHIGILNGITIANTGRYPRIVNESAWREGEGLEELYDTEVR
ncbi:MAG: hypothetical protein LBU58_06180, partial [Clostridiales bacterium]|jgi:hypothetical protein|nr:hypothetical protein [Clostridiales bacterium]